MITKIVLTMIINISLSIICGLILIPILKKSAYQRLSRYVSEHSSKAGTPTLGGLIFIIPTIITTGYLLKTNYSSTLLIII